MSTWEYTSGIEQEVTYVDAGGQPVTRRLRPGDSFGTDDACEMLRFLGATTGGVEEARPGIYQALQDACPAPAGPPTPNPTPGGDPAAHDGAPGPQVDTPPRQGAPDTATGGQADARFEPSPADARPPADQAADPRRPASDDELRATREAQGGDGDEAVRRARRNEPLPGQRHPTHSGDTAIAPSAAGDPVDLFRGLVTLSTVDLEVPSAGLPLRFLRSYRSGRPYFGPFGFGWDHSWNVHVRLLADGRIARWSGRLHEDLFTPAGAGFEPPHNVHERLEPLDPAVGSYRITLAGGVIQVFARPPGWADAERIPLLELRDRHGYRQRLSYDARGRLVRIADDDERGFALHYGGCDLLEAIEDHTGRRVAYHHAADVEHLIAVVAPATARYPGGAVTRFEYHREAPHPALRHNLRRVIDPDGRTYVQYHYLDDPASWGWNRICHQLLADHRTSYAYEPIQLVPPDPRFADVAASRTLVQAPDGAVRTYTFNYRGDLLDERVRLARDGSYRIAARQWRYDAAGNVAAAIGPDGLETRYTHDAASADPCARGNLLRIERRARPGFPSPSRIVLRATYEPTYQLPREIRDEAGAATRYGYDLDVAPGPAATGRLAFIDLPDATLPDGTTQASRHVFESDARGRLTAHVTPEGARHELEYAAAGAGRELLVRRRLDVTGANVVEELAHDPIGRIAAEADGTGAVTGSTYDAAGRLVRRVLPEVDGATAAYEAEYDGDGFLVVVRRPRGAYADGAIADPFLEDRIERDVLGRVRRIELGANTARPRIVEQRTDADGQITRLRDPSGRELRRVHDERGLLLSEQVVGADGTRAARRWIYDRAGRLQRQYTGPLEDRVTEFAYDAFGRLAAERLPSGAERRLGYGPNDRLEREQLVGDDGAGATRLLGEVRHEYDERGREVRRIELGFTDDPAAAVELVTELWHDRADRLIRRVSPRGDTTRYAHDGLGRIVREEDPLGNVRRMAYDGAHRPVVRETVDLEPSGPVSRSWRTEYDARGRQRRAIEPDGTSLELVHDDRDLLVGKLDPGGIEQRRTLGLLGELQALVVDPPGLAITERWEHDALARPVRYIDPVGEITTSTLDGLGRVIRVDEPGGASVVREHGPAGRLERELFAGGAVVEYSYDAAGRLAGLAGNGFGLDPLAPHAFRYDGADRVVEATAGADAVRRSYDSRGRLVAETTHGQTVTALHDDLAGAVTHAWPDGRRERWIVDPNDVPVALDRIAAGALGGGPAALATFTLAGPSRLGAATLAGAIDVAAAYDLRLRLVALSHAAGATTLHETAYRYDARGRRRVVLQRDGVTTPSVHRFDAHGRLARSAIGFVAPGLGPADAQADHDADIAAYEAAAAAAARVIEQDHDPADVRRAQRETGRPTTVYAYGPGHRVISAGAEAFTHAARGVRTSDGAHTYTFDVLGRVTGIRDASGALLVRIVYDALGRIGAIEQGGDLRRLCYHGRAVRQELSGAIAVRQYTPHPLLAGTPLAVHVAGATWLPVFDGHLDCVAICDASGAVLERYRYEPFGAPIVLAPGGAPIGGSAIGFEPRFGAMRYLAAAQRYLAGRRVLDPRHGLFLSPDPMGHVDSPNPYAYAAQDPIDAIDPEGELFWFVVGVIAVGALIGGGVNAARQGIQLAEGSRSEFSWGELGASAALGGALAPVLVFAPELAVPLAGLGVASSVNELSQGHYATGAFDLATSILPFGFSKVRTTTFGRGSAFSWAAGRGPLTGAGERWGNVLAAGEGIVTTVRNLGSRRFYRGTTYYEALQAEQDNALDLATVLGRQSQAQAPPRLGPGLYVTNEPGSSAIPGSAQYWADLHGLHGRAGGPAVLEGTLSWWSLRGLRDAPGVTLDVPQPGFPPNRANVESFFPFDPQSPTPAGPAARFNELATWRLWDPSAPAPGFTVPWTGWPVVPWWTTPERGGKK